MASTDPRFFFYSWNGLQSSTEWESIGGIRWCLHDVCCSFLSFWNFEKVNHISNEIKAIETGEGELPKYLEV